MKRAGAGGRTTRKYWSELWTPARFHLRRTLARLPYIPIPVRVRLDDAPKVDFWWSYVAPYFDPSRGFFDYWGHDLHELQFLWRALKPGMVFLDIGAYHGVYSLLAERRLRDSGRVVAFEPSPREFARLRLHLQWNGATAVRAEQLAVGSSSGERTFFEVSTGDTTRSGLKPPATDDAVKQIRTTTVSPDEYLAESSLGRVDIVKLDIEGGEREALRGSSSLLARYRPIFICEVLDAATEPWGYPAREIVSEFLRHEFIWFGFQPGGRLLPHHIQDNYSEVKNFLAVPREKLSSVLEDAV